MKNSKRKNTFFILGICTLLILTFFNVGSADVVRKSANTYKQKGTGPLCWSSYEYQFVNNQFMPEDRWKKNVDWIAADFKKYGYSMVCTDGWIEGSTKTNQNGYIISHNDSWTHDWAYWTKYCSSKGLQLGVYYNPMWVTPAAVNDPSKKVIGTNIPIRDIVDTTYTMPGDNSGLTGDRFGATFGRGDSTLYWVDVTKPGAKEYVEGYVNYFKKMGVKLLRVDFLSWYEDGMDKGNVVGKDHGLKNYDTSLKWMKEAAGNDMELSFVMPNLKNNGQTEIKYGDMARINEDVGAGGWYRFSVMNRGVKYDSWSVYSNPFDGLIYWSKYFGKGKMIADADMIRLNTFDTDEEKISAISLLAMSGAPIDIADEYDTIDNNAWIYQNKELLELNKQGFVGKPLSSNPDDDNSQIWTGKMPDGSYIVGLFNREESSQKRSIDFKKILKLKKKAKVRNLWTHKELGKLTSYGVSIAPHACTIIKVTP